MPQSKILVDTNAYLRLAKTIRPLLFVPFGDEQYCLYILEELNEELQNRKLRTKFHWVDEQEFVENRKYFPSIGRKQRKSIQQAFEYIWEFVQSELPGPSRVDVLYIAYAQELSLPVVTDDQDMSELAKEFDVLVMPTLELLKVMYDNGHIGINDVKGICDYWRYLSDLPANFDSDYQRFFGE